MFDACICGVVILFLLVGCSFISGYTCIGGVMKMFLLSWGRLFHYQRVGSLIHALCGDSGCLLMVYYPPVGTFLNDAC